MQNFNKYSIIIMLTMICSQGFEPGLGSFIPVTPPVSNTDITPPPSHFTMNHGFSLMANSSTFGSSTMGIYSNQVKYNFSNRLNLSSTFHLINSNQNFYSNNQSFNVKYELGLEYKLYKNSRIFFQFSNIEQQQNTPYMSRPRF